MYQRLFLCARLLLFFTGKEGNTTSAAIITYITCVYSYINELQIYVIPMVMTKKITNEVTQKSKEANVHDLYV